MDTAETADDHDGLQDVPVAGAFWPMDRSMEVGQKSWRYAKLGPMQGHLGAADEIVVVADAASLGSSGSERSVELV
jgi:hypothetical protein